MTKIGHRLPALAHGFCAIVFVANRSGIDLLAERSPYPVIGPIQSSQTIQLAFLKDGIRVVEGILRRQHAPLNASLQVNRALWLYSSIIVSVTGASWLIDRLLGHWMMIRPLFAKDDRFRDLTDYIGKTAHLRDGWAALGRGLPV